MIRYIGIGLITAYKYTLSPALSALGVKCRYDPSCSSYAIEAMQRHGFWRGGWMTAARLQRCHPYPKLGASSGIDNVPETVQKAPLWAPWRYGLWRHKSNHTPRRD